MGKNWKLFPPTIKRGYIYHYMKIIITESQYKLITEDINFDDITFFKTSQGIKYIRMSDGRLRRYKSYHSNTGGEDQGLHDWSDMSIFVGPEHDKEANSPQFLLGKGFKIGLSKTKSGDMVNEYTSGVNVSYMIHSIILLSFIRHVIII